VTQEPIKPVPTRKLDIPDVLVEHVREFLGKEGIKFFGRVKEHKGNLNCVLSRDELKAAYVGGPWPKKEEEEEEELKGFENIARAVKKARGGTSIPHLVHFREGMRVRNAMRLSDCTDCWNDCDFDDHWVEVVEKVIEATNEP
jgi:hypothetical protein